jgi:hypothetical protein
VTASGGASTRGGQEAAQLRRTLNAYADAFHHFDGGHVLTYCHEPLMLIGATGVRVAGTRADIEAWMNSFWASLKLRGFARASKVSPLRINQVSTSAAVARVRFVFADTWEDLANASRADRSRR